jgi:thymidine phosphorylase
VIPQELIRVKRDGGKLDGDQIAWLIGHLGELADAQIGALLMAMFLRGLDGEETVALTGAMRDSGTVLEWDFPTADKHSTGGVGDKVSLILGPILAAKGLHVPMISGRGLGHTGGTLDKLDSIPGYRSQPDLPEFRRVVAEAGVAIVGQTDELAPADRKLYATRDITATVECIPLIVASILSKKLAAGVDHLVMDVKTGSGAFMARREDAEALAHKLEEVSEGNGMRCDHLITDMDQVLGRTAGNALEVREAIAFLKGEPTEPRLEQVTYALAGLLVDDPQQAIASGAAAERFERMVAELGGPGDVLDADRLEWAPVRREVTARGRVRAIDVREVGLAVLELGGGRTHPEQAIDHAVGLTDVLGVGEEGPLCVIHARDEAGADRAEERIRRAFDTEG